MYDYSCTFDQNEDIKIHLFRRSGQIKRQLPPNIGVQIAIRETRLVAPWEDTGGPIRRMVNIYVHCAIKGTRKIAPCEDT